MNRLSTRIAALGMAALTGSRAAVIALACALAVAAPAAAQITAAPDGAVLVELNRADTVDGTCQATFVIANGLDAAIEWFEMSLVLFDTNGGVADSVLVAAGPFAAGDRAVGAYPIAPVGCAAVGGVLLDAAPRCDGIPGGCFDRVITANRAAIDFGR